MPFYTPLRYPGGKRRLAPLVAKILDENRLTDVSYVEPYAGGAAIALALLFEERASVVHINDLSRPVFSFWHAVLYETSELCRRIENVKVTMREWHVQRAVYETRESADVIDLGFAALFLNRTNRSGIIDGGVIGGKNQTGKWTVDARFNKTELIQRIRRIGRYRSRINLYNMDALEFTKEVVPHLGPKTFAFYDPPYIENGEDLYLNDYELDDHRRLAAKVSRLKVPWVVTYDRGAVKLGIYPSQRRLTYGLSYSAQSRYEGREVMFFADHLKLPPSWQKSGRIALSPAASPFPVYGRFHR
jgi:DNA adenine methylase